MSTVLFLEFTIENPDLKQTRAALERIATDLEPLDGFVHARTLRNTDDPCVFLLESTWSGTVPTIEPFELPPGSVKTRTWTFNILEPAWESI
jgi:hypothetical protein